MDLVLHDVAYRDADATELIEEVQQEYVARYGGRDETPVADGEFAPPGGAFVVVLADGAPIGCGGLRRHDDEAVEIKRMYIRRAYRRLGHGRRLLVALEERARALGYRRVILETGTAQPAALALYSGAGYRPIAPYGHHRCSPRSRCFGKDLPAWSDALR
jgi:GNAT superfamily N-acetyltransferase